MTRRQLILALFLAALPAATGLAQLEAPWLRATDAVYRMLSETETLSYVYLEDGTGRRRESRFSAATLDSRFGYRLTASSFAGLARRHILSGMVRDDRSRLDQNVWAYVNTRAGQKEVKHLDRQWGLEGKCRARSAERDVAHVEGCRVCRSAYNAATRGTELTCDSKKIGFRPLFPENPDTKVTLPP